MLSSPVARKVMIASNVDTQHLSVTHYFKKPHCQPLTSKKRKTEKGTCLNKHGRLIVLLLCIHFDFHMDNSHFCTFILMYFFIYKECFYVAILPPS